MKLDRYPSITHDPTLIHQNAINVVGFLKAFALSNADIVLVAEQMKLIAANTPDIKVSRGSATNPYASK